MKWFRYLLPFAVISTFVFYDDAFAQNSNVVVLANGWRIQSSAQIARAKEKVATTMPRDRTLLDMMRRTNAAAISSRYFRATGDWISATVPTTVFAALVKHGHYGKILSSTNFAKISPAPFTNSWWFRKEFSISKAQASENADLIFEGINYRANIWLNSSPIADAENTFGADRVFKFDVSGQLKRGKNVLAVEIFPPQPGDITMDFTNSSPQQPDREMGLVRPVKLYFYKSAAP